MLTCICPPPERLRDYLSGHLDAGLEQDVDEHLGHCILCLSALEELDARVHAPFVGLRRPGADSTEDEPAFRELVMRVKALPCRSQGNGWGEVLTGKMLGNYRLQECIGKGGMGQVFRAEHCRLHRVAAIKVLTPDLLRSEAARARFRREVTLLAGLQSPHIVAAQDAGESDGRDYLVMEFVEGRNLADLVRDNGPLPLQQTLAYLLQAARGLRDAHAAGIVHRDVKPANLLVDAAGVVKVLDMGLARVKGTPGAADLTAQDAVLGTAAYMAPEQALDIRAADGRADVYGLGCTLFYLLTGKPPYAGQTAMEVIVAHREQPIPSLRSARSDCPHALEALYRAMLGKKPEGRPVMEQIIVRLERLLNPKARAPERRLRYGLAVAAGLAACLLVVVALAFQPAGNNEREQPKKDGDSRVTVAPPVSVRPPTIEMLKIPAGKFWMGASESDKNAFEDEKPRHKVTITQPFLLANTKVTQAQYEEVMGVNPSAFSPGGRFKERVKDLDTRQHPVESISWLDAVRFCNRLSERHGLAPYYQIDGKTVTIYGGTGYRLPTEAEWEYACRAGTDTLWSFGEKADDLDRYAWFDGNSGDRTHPVAGKKANPWGLFDIHGNVPEWCWDRHDAEYYKRSPTSDPPGGGTGDARVHRGGAWNALAAQTRSSSRDGRGNAYAVLTLVGVRVARNAEP